MRALLPTDGGGVLDRATGDIAILSRRRRRLGRPADRSEARRLENRATTRSRGMRIMYLAKRNGDHATSGLGTIGRILKEAFLTSVQRHR